MSRLWQARLTALIAVAAMPAALAQPADTEMEAASAQARASLAGFFERFASPAPREWQFLIRFDDPAIGGAVWGEMVSHRNGVSAVRLINMPANTPLRDGVQVMVRNEQILDWSYRREGVLQGAYTLRVMIGRMPAPHGDAFRTIAGWNSGHR